MSTLIDEYISKKMYANALSQCLAEEQYYLGVLLGQILLSNDNNKHDIEFLEIYKKIYEKAGELQDDTLILPDNSSIENYKMIKVLLYCNWCDSEQLCKYWNKMSKGNYTWNNIKVVWEEPCDYYVIINAPPITIFPEPSKTILFQMEPVMSLNKAMWGMWSTPDPKKFLFCGTHDKYCNNNEWWLSKTYNQLSSETITKDESLSNTMSTILSHKYSDPGHIKRIDFVKFLDTKDFPVHVYGDNKFGWKNYKGSVINKEDGMFQYKYVFNAENYEIPNYYTEKIIDAILSECLIFYWGCPNISNFIDSRAYILLDLINFENSLEIIQTAIQENWWEKRLPYIKIAKKKILNELQFFPRLEKILNDIRRN